MFKLPCTPGDLYKFPLPAQRFMHWLCNDPGAAWMPDNLVVHPRGRYATFSLSVFFVVRVFTLADNADLDATCGIDCYMGRPHYYTPNPEGLKFSFFVN